MTNIDQMLQVKDLSPIETHLSPIELPTAQDAASLLKNLCNSDCLERIDSIFSEYPEKALLVKRSRSLIYVLTRYLQPNYVLEIGTYKAGTSEIFTRALRMNGKGTLITTDPFGQERVPLIIETWPDTLKKQVVYMPLSSMDCFIQLDGQNMHFDLLFIDGDHSYEYALYDLQMAARLATPGAVIIMDNVEQTGVYWATKTFLSINPDWQELGSSIADHDIVNPYTTMRPSFPESSFLILQGPTRILITNQPRSFMTSNVQERGLAGFELALSGLQDDGVVNIMTFFRSFWHGGHIGEPEQKVQCMNFPIKAGEKSSCIAFPELFITGHVPKNSYRTFEIVLTWLPSDKSQPLELTTPPIPIKIV